MAFGTFGRVDMINMMLILSRSTGIQGREPKSGHFVQKIDVGFHSDVCRPISFKLTVTIDANKL